LPVWSGRRWRRAAAHTRAAATLLAAVLAGCSWVSSLNPLSSGPSSQATGACPTATILSPLAHTAVFAPGRDRSPISVAFYGVLNEVSAKCEVAGGALHVALDVIVVGERGPAGSGDAVNLNYFVAVTGPGEALLSKRTLPVTVAIPADTKRAGVTDHLDETIPLAGLTPGQLTIDLGFQQSPDVVDFYRHFRGI
jgi:hypothetical protein